MVEFGEPEGGSFHPFGEIVDRFSRPIAHVGVVPRHNLLGPFLDGATEPANLDRHFRVGEITDDLGDPLTGQIRVGVGVGLTDDLFRVPREPHFSAVVTGTNEADHPVPLIVAEALGCHRESPSRPVERIIFVAPMTKRFVLHPPTALIQRLVCEADHMKRVSHLDCPGQSRWSNTFRYTGDRSSVAQRIAASHDAGRPSSHRQQVAASRPSTTSRSCPLRTSTIWVDHAWVR